MSCPNAGIYIGNFMPRSPLRGVKSAKLEKGFQFQKASGDYKEKNFGFAEFMFQFC